MFTLNADQLRELAEAIQSGDLHAHRRAGLAVPSVWTELAHAAQAAAKAHPECPCCKGYGVIELPDRHAGPDDGDTEEVVCPVCRPWPQGFPGLRDSRRYSRQGVSFVIDDGWLIPPYGPGEGVDFYNYAPVVLAWDDDGAPVLKPSEF